MILFSIVFYGLFTCCQTKFLIEYRSLSMLMSEVRATSAHFIIAQPIIRRDDMENNMSNFKKVKGHLSILLLVTAMAACSGSNDNPPNEPAPPSPAPAPAPSADTSPDTFSFTEQIDVAPEAPITSEAITVTGIDDATPVSVEGGEFSINGADFTSEASTISANDSLVLRVTSHTEPGEIASVTVTVGDYSASFDTTTSIPASPLVHEAESLSLVGNTSIQDYEGASQGQVVTGFLQPDDGISFTEVVKSVALRVTYRASLETALTVWVNDAEAAEVVLSPTVENTFFNAIVEMDVVSTDRVSLTSSNENSELQIDKLEWIESPLQQVRTFANAGLTGGDGISVSPEGDVFVSGGSGSGQVNKISQAGDVTVYASGLRTANGSDFDSQGNFYVADYQGNAVYKVDTNGSQSVFASELDGPAGVYVDQNDNVLVSLYGANFSGTAATVLSITPGGVVSVLANGGGLLDVIGVVGDENGEIYAGNFNTGRLFRVTNGEVSLLADLSVNVNMIDYSRGYIYVATRGRITRVSVDGIEETVSGSGTQAEIDGLIGDAEFSRPSAVAFSPNGNILYVYDAATGNVRSITFSDE